MVVLKFERNGASIRRKCACIRKCYNITAVIGKDSKAKLIYLFIFFIFIYLLFFFLLFFLLKK